MSSPIVAKRKLNRTVPQPMQLEQRFMFDGAAVVDLLNEASKTGLDPALEQALDVQPAAIEAPALFQTQVNDPVLQTAITAAQQSVRDFINQADDQTLFSLFNGGQSEPDAQWSQRLADLRAAINDGSLSVNVVSMDIASQFTAVAAFSQNGPDGKPTIFVNAFWFGMFDAPDITRALVEELGHAVDTYLNPNTDTPGDEGEAFADTVIDGQLGAAQSAGLLTQNDYGQVAVNGVTYDVEFASLSFVNAYEMVYDLNNSSGTSGSVSEAAIDTNERWADKEQNLHYFNTSTSLGVTVINDGTSMQDFSGNDVSGALSVTIGSNTYYGWVSRPIKVGGVVKGFYFWTDSSFTTLSLAQQDGNQDGDSSVLDNRGFVLVVNQSHFDSLSATNYTINNIKDGNLGTVAVKNIGSSSDRVDSALNSLVRANTAPTANNDTASGTPSATPSTGTGNAALEQGYNTNTSTVITATINGSGNVLANDTDTNSDALSVTTVTSKSTGNSSTATSAGVNITGKYGTLNIKSDGNWTYTLDNLNTTVDALLSGNVTEQFTYTASDSKGGTATATLTVQINGSNDAPVAANDYNTAKEITTTSNTGYNATGNVLTNDTDVDTGDGKTISGASVSGSVTSSTVSVTPGGTTIQFTTSSGFNSVTASTGASADEAFVHLGIKTAATSDVYTGLYTYNSGTGAYTLIYVTAKTASSGSAPGSITFNSTPTHYWDTSTSTFTTIVNESTGQTLATFFANNPNLIFKNTTDSTPTVGETYTQRNGC